jgi:hypothetical protein
MQDFFVVEATYWFVVSLSLRGFSVLVLGSLGKNTRILCFPGTLTNSHWSIR